MVGTYSLPLLKFLLKTKETEEHSRVKITSFSIPVMVQAPSLPPGIVNPICRNVSTVSQCLVRKVQPLGPRVDGLTQIYKSYFYFYR